MQPDSQAGALLDLFFVSFLFRAAPERHCLWRTEHREQASQTDRNTGPPFARSGLGPPFSALLYCPVR